VTEFPKIHREFPSVVFLAKMRALGASIPKFYSMGDLTIQLSQSDEEYMVISIGGKKRDPKWEEIKHIQNELCPDLFFCLPMPPKSEWMSIAPHCYHLYEVKDARHIEMWKASGMLAREYPEGTTLDDLLEKG
jgi:hypothetical protein